MLPFFFLLPFISLLKFSAAAPARAHFDDRSVTALSAADLTSLAPYTRFARVAHCPTSKLKGWNCGGESFLFSFSVATKVFTLTAICNALPGFQPTLIGGDGNAVKFVGVNLISMSVLTDVNILMSSLDTKLFPGISPSVQVHTGFGDEHALTAAKILAEVKNLMASKNTQSITLVGHSLGGVLSTLDGVYLKTDLPANTSFKVVTYGLPRIGNPAFAQLVDSMLPDFRRINRQLDIVPIIPGRFLGYSHPQGQIHLISPGNTFACSGDDDATDSNLKCQIQSVPSVLAKSILNHISLHHDIAIARNELIALDKLESWDLMRGFTLALSSASDRSGQAL
ncbi:hypothetical protein K443DRAFT_127635 [Laccaria amethystina LaAM-08-1]|uniref:Fungal lipase-type domain-containing protein n=1 Tax=Laccaria amethystina LaAM-08-1 TaxID=1095629 RepID=A0A0C9XVW5_9AGAR|nr:hypothetical protein K443DRAFT_127635 [Laccaria amethystina LaAM-08-1]